MKFRILLFLPTLIVCSLAAAVIEPRIAPHQPDALELLDPAGMRIDGFLGARMAANESARLLQVDEAPLLAGYRNKPGTHPWIGEHVGKWLHAATLAWVYTGDPALREKVNRVATELIKTQEPDGYLGTYVPGKRFGLYKGADWDVWSHKYNLLGLLTYYQYTGDPAALQACRKVGDLLIATFGPGKKSILSAGTHMGMASTSVLEPIVLLYRFTGDEHYLEFARYIVSSWDEPNGPAILKTLLTEKNVSKTANGKAYEMLSNLVGLCELYRATGQKDYLRAALNAWEDIASHRLYITGSASQGEHFHSDFELPNRESAAVAEGCVTSTWLQLTLQLYRLTGEARFGNELERTLYNHTAAAQRPDGKEWCYFTPLEGKKPYGPGINCCVSSGPRAMALAPFQCYLKRRVSGNDALVVSTFEPSRVSASLGGAKVTLQQESAFPKVGESTFNVHAEKPVKFALQLRVPEWALPVEVKINGKAIKAVAKNGWMLLPARKWGAGDAVALRYNLSARLIPGEHGNAGLAALTWGPFVLACDSGVNPGLPAPTALGFAGTAAELIPGANLTFKAPVRSARNPTPVPATFVTFADAGANGSFYSVWLHGPGTAFARTASLLADGQESRSREGNVEGSIVDGDAATFVVTFDATKANEDWYAVTLPSPIEISRVTFVHGTNFHDGGWFDTSAGKPKVQIQSQTGAAWETVAELSDYPATSGSDAGTLKAGRAFTAVLPNRVKAAAIRVVGVPGHGDNPAQAFSSCAELQAY